ncbi:RING finger domain-containing protein, partial [Salmonella sp. s58953]|uniref:RING finger domain-containing protein n=1 Tax=Salmonella sp. s58953 TaxID=3159711 RepID=UPI00397EB8DE
MELFGLKKKSRGSKSDSSNNKLEWKATEQDECAICLDQFVASEALASLPCAHRFHSRCLVPWLE